MRLQWSSWICIWRWRAIDFRIFYIGCFRILFVFLRRFLPLASVAFGIRGLRSFWIGFWLLTKEGRLSGLLDSVAFGFWLVLFDCAILFIIYLSLSYSILF